nr:uncharacterized protein LOC129272406 [Lytechinus pictus]
MACQNMYEEHVCTDLEEKVLVLTELVKDEGDNQEFESTGEDFTTTDALLEQIAETITSIEKAQNPQSFTGDGCECLADCTRGQGRGRWIRLDLQADIPSQVDEQGINIPSAQIILAVPTESTLLEVSEEDRSDVQPIDIDETKKEAKEETKEDTTEKDGEKGATDAEKLRKVKVCHHQEKSPRFKLHLPKFHLPKMHLSGKKDKKKQEIAQEEEEVKDVPSQADRPVLERI